ncbi:MAG: DUF3775 domain-containing protein [Alphaproteobacteria bacterium]|nr:DUF3775 domain-containing protein [Alphaproteobacteria bacterium]
MVLSPQTEADTDELELGIATDKVCYIIVKARQFDVKEGNADPNSGSDAIDDGFTDVLEDKPDDPVFRELTGFISGLDIEEQLNLVALAWLGRGTYDKTEWSEALTVARQEHNNRTAQYLLGLPLLGDYLEEGLSQFGRGCADESETR